LRLALLILLAPALVAQNLDPAVRDLARKVAAVVREAQPVTVAAAPAGVDAADLRLKLRAALNGMGVKLAAAATAEILVTVSRSWKERLLIAEVRRGEDRTVLIVPWPPESAGARPAAVTISRTPLREQPGVMLDAGATADGTLVVLEPERVALYGKTSAALTVEPRVAPPRDPRGRLVLEGGAFQAFLPGVTCRGTVDPAAMECQAGVAEWPLDSAGKAAFRTGRNHFDGPVTTITGAYRKLLPFYAGAYASGRWVFTGLDARAGIYNEKLESLGSTAAAGSDVAGTACGLLATRPGDAQRDAVQVFEVRDTEIAAISAPLEFSGTVTALWPAGKDAAVAVARDASTGTYAAYRLVVTCAP